MENENARRQTLEQLHERRKQVVRLHKKGIKIMHIVDMTGLDRVIAFNRVLVAVSNSSIIRYVRSSARTLFFQLEQLNCAMRGSNDNWIHRCFANSALLKRIRACTSATRR